MLVRWQNLIFCLFWRDTTRTYKSPDDNGRVSECEDIAERGITGCSGRPGTTTTFLWRSNHFWMSYQGLIGAALRTNNNAFQGAENRFEGALWKSVLRPHVEQHYGQSLEPVFFITFNFLLCQEVRGNFAPSISLLFCIHCDRRRSYWGCTSKERYFFGRSNAFDWWTSSTCL